MTDWLKNWTEVEYEGKTYTVPATGRDENLNAMLTLIPEDDFDNHAWAFLMQDGNLGVPGGRYGRDTRDCAPIAILMAEIMQYHNGEPITYYQLDSDMGLVVNSSDDVAYMIYEYGGLVKGDDFKVEDYLDESDIAEAKARFEAEWGER
jgi:hypothetical protein